MSLIEQRLILIVLKSIFKRQPVDPDNPVNIDRQFDGTIIDLDEFVTRSELGTVGAGAHFFLNPGTIFLGNETTPANPADASTTLNGVTYAWQRYERRGNVYYYYPTVDEGQGGAFKFNAELVAAEVDTVNNVLAAGVANQEIFTLLG